jgi:hypothetical protein
MTPPLSLRGRLTSKRPASAQRVTRESYADVYVWRSPRVDFETSPPRSPSPLMVVSQSLRALGDLRGQGLNSSARATSLTWLLVGASALRTVSASVPALSASAGPHPQRQRHRTPSVSVPHSQRHRTLSVSVPHSQRESARTLSVSLSAPSATACPHSLRQQVRTLNVSASTRDVSSLGDAAVGVSTVASAGTACANRVAADIQAISNHAAGQIRRRVSRYKAILPHIRVSSPR